MLSDVAFVVEGKKFHAHRIALLASSDAFRAMFGGDYREKVGVVVRVEGGIGVRVESCAWQNCLGEAAVGHWLGQASKLRAAQAARAHKPTYHPPTDQPTNRDAGGAEHRDPQHRVGRV